MILTGLRRSRQRRREARRERREQRRAREGDRSLEDRIAERTAELESELQKRELLEARLRRIERAEAVGQLASGYAHDLNNALTVILGAAESGLRRDTTTAELHERLEDICAAAERSSELVREMLDANQTSRAAPQLIDSGEFLSRLTARFEAIASPGISVDVAAAPTSATVQIRAVHLEQILLNLLFNARDAVGQSGHIRVNAERANDVDQKCIICGGALTGRYVMFSVEDDGVGLDDATREQMFGAFFSTREDRGSGLGLTMVKELVHTYGGHLLIRSAPEQPRGTTFSFLLPAATDLAPGTDPTGPTNGRPAARRDDAHGPAVAVVEDNRRVRDLICRILQSVGIAHAAFEDGESLLEAVDAETIHPRQLVVDYALPGMSGLIVAREIKRRLSGVAVLVVTGHREVIDLRHSHGIDDVLLKPFSHAQFLSAVERLAEDAEAPGA